MLMRNRARALAIVAVAVLGGVGPRAQEPSTPQEEAEHEAIRGLRAVYERAVNDNRVDELEPLLHPEFTGVMMTGREVTSFDEVRSYWRDIRELIGENGRYTTTVRPEWSTLLGDVALARGTTDDVVVTSEGQEFRFQSFWTAVLQKHGGRWTLRRVQGSMDPVSNPFVTEFARRAVVRTAIVAGLLGVLLGAGMAALIRRRTA